MKRERELIREHGVEISQLNEKVVTLEQQIKIFGKRDNFKVSGDRTVHLRCLLYLVAARQSHRSDF